MMIKFNKPQNLNGAELRQELNNIGVQISNQPTSVEVDNDDNLWLDIASEDEAKAKVIVDNHNGTTVAPEPTIEQKLASVGLSVEDLKAALGL
jgi:predicted nucleic acid-binding protein